MWRNFLSGFAIIVKIIYIFTCSQIFKKKKINREICIFWCILAHLRGPLSKKAHGRETRIIKKKLTWVGDLCYKSPGNT